MAAGAGSNRSHSGGLRSLRTALRHIKKVVIVVIMSAWITWKAFCCDKVVFARFCIITPPPVAPVL